MAQRLPLTVRYRKTAGLIPYARNARTHSEAQVAQLAGSLREFGWTNPVLVDPDGGIIAGHGRVMAARKLGMDEVPTITLSGLSEAQKRAYVLADNRLALNAGWDAELLALELQGLTDDGYDLALTGFPEDEIAALLAGASTDLEGMGGDGEVVEDDVPEPPKNPITKLGDVWTLGRHRLVCGDCRDPAVVAKLVAGRQVNVAFTSPPYASQRKYDESSGFKPIPPGEYVAWFEAVQANVRSVLAPDGSWFVNIKEHCDDGARSLYVKDLTLAHVRKWGWRFVDELCWVHHGFPGEVFDRFRNAWEPVFHFATAKRAKCRPDQVAYESDSVIEYRPETRESMTISSTNHSGATRAAGKAFPRNVLKLSNGASTSVSGHAATFPVGLPAFFLRAYSDEGDLVLDPFMGSGTSLIASEQLGRASVGVELSPAYCDVIAQRWETLTGKRAARQRG